MTRLYISADLEGACGVTSPLQCSPTADRPAYDWAVTQLAREVKEVVEAALEAGARKRPGAELEVKCQQQDSRPGQAARQ